MSSLFNPKTPDIPPPPAPKPMPDPDDPKARAARRMAMEEMMRRGGRASTNLERNEGGGTIAGCAYSKTKLG